MDYTEKTLASKECFKGRIFSVHVDDIELIDGHRSKREIVEHDGGVTVIPVDENGMVTCVRQYRYAFGEHVLETPAGKLEKGEEPFVCAVRELKEETGYTADEYVYLGEFYPSPGYCHEKLHAYLALGLHKGEAKLDEGEFLDVEVHALDELAVMAMDNRLKDAKTIIAVLKAKLYMEARGKKI